MNTDYGFFNLFVALNPVRKDQTYRKGKIAEAFRAFEKIYLEVILTRS